MNYDHDFHAGNFADVLKHVVLTRILVYLKRKPAPFRVIDTHAGSGGYDLCQDAAGRTGEWREGIGRLAPDALEPQARALIEPYHALAAGAVAGDAPYPGSPAIAAALARPFDRIIACELHPRALAALKARFNRDKRIKIIALDGYTGLNAFIPPVERRGLVLIDPPFETQDEFARLTAAILAAHAKWREGILLAWYPIKERHGVERMSAALAASGIDDALRLELRIAEARADGRLAACGLIVVNPPYVLEAEMACLLPALARQLGAAGTCHIDRVGHDPRGAQRP